MRGRVAVESVGQEWLFGKEATQVMPNIARKQRHERFVALGKAALGLAAVAYVAVKAAGLPAEHRAAPRPPVASVERVISRNILAGMHDGQEIDVLTHVTAVGYAKPTDIEGISRRQLIREPAVIEAGDELYLVSRDYSGQNVHWSVLGSEVELYCIEEGMEPALAKFELGYNSLTSGFAAGVAKHYAAGFPSQEHADAWCGGGAMAPEQVKEMLVTSLKN